MTRFGPVVCICSCAVFIAIIITQRILFGKTVAEDILPHNFSPFSLNCAIVFGALSFCTLTSCFSSIGAQLTCSITACVVSLIAASSHFLASQGLSPISISTHSLHTNVIVHTYWAEWMASTPLLVFVLGHVTQLQPRYVFGGMGLQFLTILTGYLAVLSPSLYAQVVYLSCSCALCFFILACIYTLSVPLSYHRFVLQQSRRTQTAYLNQTMIKALGCSTVLLWLAYPVAFFLNMAGLLPSRMYIMFTPAFDVVAKAMFTAILSTIHSEGETKRMEALVQELKTDNEMQTKFMRFVYHEIRNPFNTIMLGLNHLEEEEALLPYRELIVVLRRSATAMNQVIDDVVELTQARGLNLVNEAVDVKVLVDSAVDTFNDLISQKYIEILEDVSSSFPARLQADPTKLKKVFEVLISNAVKFSPNGSTVTVSLQVVDITYGICTLVFSVSDEGPGIPEKIATMLFQPFSVVRPGDFSEDENRGSGLGLCFAKHLADLMNGTLSFAKNKERGMTFSLSVALEICPPPENELLMWKYMTPRVRGFFANESPCAQGATVNRNNIRTKRYRTTSGSGLLRTRSAIIPHNLRLKKSKTTDCAQILQAQPTTRASRPRFTSVPFQGNEAQASNRASRPRFLSNTFQAKGNEMLEDPPVRRRHRLSLTKFSKHDPNFDCIVGNGPTLEPVVAMTDLEAPSPGSSRRKILTERPGKEQHLHFPEKYIHPFRRASGTPDMETGRQSLRHRFSLTKQEPPLNIAAAYEQKFNCDARATNFENSSPVFNICKDIQENRPSDEGTNQQDLDDRRGMREDSNALLLPLSNSNEVRQQITALRLDTVFSAERNVTLSIHQSQSHSSNESTVTGRQSAMQSARCVTFGVSSDSKKEHKGLLAHRGGGSTSCMKRHRPRLPSLKISLVLEKNSPREFPATTQAGGGDSLENQEAQVLIVDDVKSNQKLVHLILQKAGYVCDLASDGQEAVGMARQHQYQLIIMDNVMPIMDGVEATRRITAFDKEVAIVGLTGNVLQKDQLEFLQAGARFIIEKPATRHDSLLPAKSLYINQQ